MPQLEQLLVKHGFLSARKKFDTQIFLPRKAIKGQDVKYWKLSW
jgi:hypothetical protein